jgi:hypothetical protein
MRPLTSSAARSVDPKTTAAVATAASGNQRFHGM